MSDGTWTQPHEAATHHARAAEAAQKAIKQKLDWGQLPPASLVGERDAHIALANMWANVALVTPEVSGEGPFEAVGHYSREW